MKYIALKPSSVKLKDIRIQGEVIPITTKEELLEILFNNEVIELEVNPAFIDNIFERSTFNDVLELSKQLHPSIKKISNYKYDKKKFVLNESNIPIILDPIELSHQVVVNSEFSSLLINTINQAKELTKTRTKEESEINSIAGALIESQEEVKRLNDYVKSSKAEVVKINSIMDKLIQDIHFVTHKELKRQDFEKISLTQLGSYTRLLHFKTFSTSYNIASIVEGIRELLKLHVECNMRIIIIDSQDAITAFNLYPDTYKDTYLLKERDYVKGDIKMLGLQKDVIEAIIKNPYSEFSTLCIVDNRNTADLLISKEDIKRFKCFELFMTEALRDLMSKEVEPYDKTQFIVGSKNLTLKDISNLKILNKII